MATADPFAQPILRDAFLIIGAAGLIIPAFHRLKLSPVLGFILVGVLVAVSGGIGFVGLVGPHMARMLVGEDQRYFLPASMAAGAAVMCAAHAVSLMIKPGLAIPIGIVTSLLGVPFFIAIVMTRRRALWT